MPQSFTLKDCALIAIATGRRAQTLKELRDHLQSVPVGSIYHHFWGHLLEARFDEPEFNNDIAAWVRHALHDKALAERLAVIDPTDFPDLEALRQELIDVIEERLDESDYVTWSRSDQQFEFIHSQIVVFDTRRRVERPEDFTELLPHISASSVFYHFIDARRRNDERIDDLCAWMGSFEDGYAGLKERLAEVDPFFATLTELRDQLSAAFRDYFQGEQ